jgi:elongation factor P
MAALIEAITVKRKMYFEFENTPYYCMEAEVSTPTARGGQTLVRLKMRNLLTRAVFDKTFKAGDRFKEPDLETVEASYLYSDGDGSYFLDQETFETLRSRPHDGRCTGVPGGGRSDSTAQVQREPHRPAFAGERWN